MLQAFNNFKKFNVRTFSNVEGSSLQELQALKTSKETALAAAKAEVARLEALINYDGSYYNSYAAQNKWSEAMFHSSRMNNETKPALASANTLVNSLQSEINSLADQIKAAVTEKLSNANLTPEQRAQLEQQRLEAETAAAKTQAASKNKKTIIVILGILAGLGIIGGIWYGIKTAKS